MARMNKQHDSSKTNPSGHDDEGSRSARIDTSRSYRRQIKSNSNKSEITTDPISSQTGISQDKLKKIIHDAYLTEEGRKGEFVKRGVHSSNLKSSSSSPNSQVVGLNSIIKKSQTRVRKTLEGKPEFVMSLVETQNVLGKFDKNKATFVVLHVDLVGSTKLAMMLPMDRLTKIIQAFNQEMSLAVKAFGGHILKYVGDAVLAFFVVVTEHKSEAKVACINAINCANYMLRIAHEAINPILRQYGCPEMNLRIGVDIGENAIIQSGWDIHPNIRNRHKNRKNTSITNHNKKRRDPLMKKAVYDVLSYTLSIAVKMTALARPNHLVIGDPVYTRLDHKQRSAFQRVHISPDIWDYVCKNSEVNIYDLYTNV